MANRKASNDKPNRGEPDQYDRDLERDSRRAAGGNDAREPGNAAGRPRTEGQEQMHAGFDRDALAQKDRKGQAQSPVEQTLNQPPRHKEGHGTRPDTHE